MYGKDVMETLQQKHTSEYFELFRDFERLKRDFNYPLKRVIIKPPVALNDLYQEKNGKHIKDHLSSVPNYGNTVKWRGRDKMEIDPIVVENFFTQALDKATEHMKSLFAQPALQDVKTLIMVGGFSESGLLQTIIKQSFPDKQIIVPCDQGLAILKGAVIFGHDPSVMTERRSRYTYGVSTSKPFNADSHPQLKKTTDDEGKEYCSDCFDVHVTAGQEVALGSSNVVRSYSPFNKNQTKLGFSFYASTDKNPSYVTDPNCILIGHHSVDINSSGDDRSVSVNMIFGDTELRVEAIENATQKPSKCTLNFLG
ncbi:hypothetical protein DPMN_094871 [Dreissena polymorpha]|uniref:Uncharacterized protein n=1 Tax=Dreissena polymorpha TaxID=45954 RepID=A0A9D4L5G9_DREPO|nr:hypothetical protein DPMN_094871 [Dreissena polymorpha]